MTSNRSDAPKYVQVLWDAEDPEGLGSWPAEDEAGDPMTPWTTFFPNADPDLLWRLYLLMRDPRQLRRLEKDLTFYDIDSRHYGYRHDPFRYVHLYVEHTLERLLELADWVIDGFGVEGIQSDERIYVNKFYGQIWATYVNQGDLYLNTIWLDTTTETFHAGCLGSWIEARERELLEEQGFGGGSEDESEDEDFGEDDGPAWGEDLLTDESWDEVDAWADALDDEEGT